MAAFNLISAFLPSTRPFIISYNTANAALPKDTSVTGLAIVILLLSPLEQLYHKTQPSYKNSAFLKVSLGRSQSFSASPGKIFPSQTLYTRESLPRTSMYPSEGLSD